MAPGSASPDDMLAQLGRQARQALSGFMASSHLDERHDSVDAGSMATLTSRSAISPRSLSGGAIAGAVIGSLVGAALLLLCAYPFVVYLFKRISRRRLPKDDGTSFDPEAAEVPASAPEAAGASESEPVSGQHRRLSMRESFSTKYDEISGKRRQSTKEFHPFDGWSLGSHGRPQPQRVDSIDRGTLDSQMNWPSRQPTDLSSMGQSLATTQPQQSRQGTLNDLDLSMMESHGANEDYYSPTVPSEAFGMDFQQPPQAIPSEVHRTTSRSSSLRHNILAMIRRGSKDSRHGISSVAAIAQPAIAVADPTLAVSPIQSIPLPRIAATFTGPPEQIMETDHMSESPTEMVPPAFPDQASAPKGLASPISMASPPAAALSPGSSDGDYDRLTPERTLAPGALLPSYNSGALSPPIPSPVTPAPGTVNPRDVMNASTPSERIFHTNQELHRLSQSPDPTPPRSTSDYAPNMPDDQPITANGYLPGHEPSPPTWNVPENLPAQVTPNRDPATPEPPIRPIVTQPTMRIDPVEVKMEDPPDTGGLMPPRPYGRNSQDSDRSMTSLNTNSSLNSDQGGPSDTSSPFRRPHSSSLSNRNTPFTPATDINNSPSPKVESNSPRIFICDLCSRQFDQIHKLNHHKRYHERPHVCTHQDCGKRFGTKTHLERHVNDKHRKTKAFHCTEPSCAYSKFGGRSFPRKDNWRRHMVNIHNQNPTTDPIPETIDVAMGGI